MYTQQKRECITLVGEFAMAALTPAISNGWYKTRNVMGVATDLLIAGYSAVDMGVFTDHVLDILRSGTESVVHVSNDAMLFIGNAEAWFMDKYDTLNATEYVYKVRRAFADGYVCVHDSSFLDACSFPMFVKCNLNKGGTTNSTSRHLALEIGDSVRLHVEITFVGRLFYSRYGPARFYVGKTSSGDVVTWFSKHEFCEHESYTIFARLRAFTEYRGTQQTRLNYVRMLEQTDGHREC